MNRRLRILCSVDLMFYSLVVVSVYQLIGEHFNCTTRFRVDVSCLSGPWYFGYLSEDRFGVIFFWGSFVRDSFLPADAQLSIGFFQVGTICFSRSSWLISFRWSFIYFLFRWHWHWLDLVLVVSINYVDKPSSEFSVVVEWISVLSAWTTDSSFSWWSSPSDLRSEWWFPTGSLGSSHRSVLSCVYFRFISTGNLINWTWTSFDRIQQSKVPRTRQTVVLKQVILTINKVSFFCLRNQIKSFGFPRPFSLFDRNLLWESCFRSLPFSSVRFVHGKPMGNRLNKSSTNKCRLFVVQREKRQINSAIERIFSRQRQTKSDGFPSTFVRFLNKKYKSADFSRINASENQLKTNSVRMKNSEHLTKSIVEARRISSRTWKWWSSVDVVRSSDRTVGKSIGFVFSNLVYDQPDKRQVFFPTVGEDWERLADEDWRREKRFSRRKWCRICSNRIGRRTVSLADKFELGGFHWTPVETHQRNKTRQFVCLFLIWKLREARPIEWTDNDDTNSRFDAPSHWWQWTLARLDSLTTRIYNLAHSDIEEFDLLVWSSILTTLSMELSNKLAPEQRSTRIGRRSSLLRRAVKVVATGTMTSHFPSDSRDLREVGRVASRVCVCCSMKTLTNLDENGLCFSMDFDSGRIFFCLSLCRLQKNRPNEEVSSKRQTSLEWADRTARWVVYSWTGVSSTS